MATAGGEGVPATGTQEGQADSHEAPQHLSEIRIILLGGRQVGKCSSGNTILGREEFKTGRKTYCVRRQGEVAGRQVTVVYTPGWRWKWWAPAQATPEHLKQDIRCSVSLCPPGPHAFLLVIPVDSPFTENHRRSVEEHLELLTERVWRHTMVLFTQAHALRDTTIGQHIEGAGEELQRLVEKCGNRYHVLNNRYRGDRTQVTELLEKIEDMVAGTSACYFSDEMERNGWRDEEPKGSRRKEPTAETAKRQFVKSNMRNSLVHPPNMAPGGRQERREIAELRQEWEERLQRKEREIQQRLEAELHRAMKEFTRNRSRAQSAVQPPSSGGGAAPETSPAETPPPSTLSKLRGDLEQQQQKLNTDLETLREERERLEREKEAQREEKERLEREKEALREERKRLEREETLRQERQRERSRALEELEREMKTLREEQERDRRQREETHRREMEGVREEQERERREREETHKREMEELRQHYEEKAREEAERHRETLQQVSVSTTQFTPAGQEHRSCRRETVERHRETEELRETVERHTETEDLRETVERCRGEIEELRETVRETVARHRETEELRETVERHTETEDLRETVERCRGEIEELRETVRETVERYRRETVTLGQGCETQARQQAEGSEAQPSVVKALL